MNDLDSKTTTSQVKNRKYMLLPYEAVDSRCSENNTAPKYRHKSNVLHLSLFSK